MDDLLIEAVRRRAKDPSRATDGADAVSPRVFPVALPDLFENAWKAKFGEENWEPG